jgi:hypothetical protein
MKHGAVPASSIVPYKEEYFNFGLSGTVTQGNNIAFAGPTLTTPFPGRLAVNLWVTVNWSSGLCGIDVTGNMSPPPNGSWTGLVIDYTANGGWAQIPYMAYWAGLAQGQVVPLNLLGRCSLANNPVNLSSIFGQARYSRTA